MNDTAAWANVIAVVSIVATLLGILASLYLLRKQLMVQNFAEYTRRYQEIIRELPEDIYEPGFTLEALEGPEKLRKYKSLMICYFDICFEEYSMRRMRIVSGKVWRLWEVGIRSTLKRRAFRDSWVRLRGEVTYGDEGFKEYMDRMAGVGLAEETRP